MSTGKGTLTSGVSGQDAMMWINVQAENGPFPIENNGNINVFVPEGMNPLKHSTIVFDFDIQANVYTLVSFDNVRGVGQTNNDGTYLQVIEPGPTGFEPNAIVSINQNNSSGFNDSTVNFNNQGWQAGYLS